MVYMDVVDATQTETETKLTHMGTPFSSSR